MRLDVTRLFQFLGLNTQGDLGPYTFYTDKRKNLVWFLKAPPLQPPSYLQNVNRNRWRAMAHAWHDMGEEERMKWKAAAQRINAAITYYNLFAHFQLRYDPGALATIERLSKIQLFPPHKPFL